VDSTQHLRVLVANHPPDRVELIAATVVRLGHEVVAREVNASQIAEVTGRLRPDLALVGLGGGALHALKLITGIVRAAFCPVIALLDSYDPDWIDQAAERGVYAYIVNSRPEELQSAIETTLRRYVEFQGIRGAFDRNNAHRLRDEELRIARRRQLLAIQDGVVQGLSVAHLAIQLNRPEQSREAVLVALENARAIVSRCLDELRSEGIPLEQLIADAAPVRNTSNGSTPRRPATARTP
jgi:AmiR/NasT family two-component response regulator